ncbi:glycosyltransferase [Minwuia sp.]|uniref:glycosyltransferase n=1 Tax=Minwuia sp. TaxID=2493630 RepID=UPI003A95483D
MIRALAWIERLRARKESDAPAPEPEQPVRPAATEKKIDPGIAANRAGDWSAAARIWGQRALQTPDKPRPHLNYIRALMRQERLSEAAAASDIARAHLPEDEEIAYRRVTLLERLGMDADLRREAGKPDMRTLAESSGRIALVLARFFWRQSDDARARPLFETALADPATTAPAEIYLARMDYRTGNWDAAEARWKAIAASGAHKVRAEEPLLFLGRIALRRGDRALAEEHFAEARAIAPGTAARIDKWLAGTAPADAPVPEDPSADDMPAAEPDLPAAPPETELPAMAVPDDDPVEPQPVESDTSPDELLTVARQHLAEDRHTEARDCAFRILSADASSSAAAEIAGFASNRCGDWAAAARAWSALAELQPGRVGPLLQAATAYEQLGQRREALDCGERALAIDPENDAAMILCARQLSRLEDLPGLEAFAQAVARGPEERLPVRLITTLVDGFVGLGALEAANDWTNKGMRRDPPPQEVALRKARLLYAARDYQASGALWQQLLDAPETVVRPFEPHVFLARCASQANDFETAAVHFRQAVEINPDHLDSREGLITSLLRSGDFHAADSANETFRTRHPDRPRGAVLHVLIGYRLMDAAETDRRLETAFETLKQDAAALLQLGRAIESQQDHDRALSFWRRATELFPQDPELLYRLINQMFSQELSARETLPLAEKLLNIDPDHEGGLFYFATLNHRLGQPETANTAFMRGIDLYPGNIGFWIGHANNLMTADKVGEARALLDRARQSVSETDPIALADLARLAEVVDLPDDADELFDRALTLSPNDVVLWRRAVRFNMNLGAYGKAWDLAQKGRRIDRTDRIITSALVQTASVLQTMHADWPATDPARYADVRVPDDLFSHVARRTWPRPADDAGDRRGAMLVTSSLGSGGSERQVMFSMQALARVDHGYDDVHLVARSLNADHRHDFFLPLVRESGYGVIDLGDREAMDHIRQLGDGAIRHREAIRLAAAMPAEVEALTLPLLGVFLKHRPEVVHLWQDTVNVAGGFAALLAGVPNIVMGTRSTRPDARRRMRRYLEPGYHAMLALPNVRMVNNSRNGARDYEDWLGLPDGSVGVIHNGFDVDRIRATATAAPDDGSLAALGIPESAPVIGGVMRFSEEKRPELFTDAAIALSARLPHAHFILVGDGPLRPELMRKVAEAGLPDRIHMPGAKRPVEPWMARMSVLVLTSRMEGLPNVLIEAQILGVPVAATQVGGVPETMIPGETGIMVDSGDPGVLADHLFDLVSDPARLRHMSSAAKEWAERSFSLEGMIRNTLDHYRTSP